MTPTRHVTADDSRRQVTTAASPLLKGCRCQNQWGGSEEERGGKKWSEEAGEWGRRRPCLLLPSFSFFISNQGSTHCPISLIFERGQHSLPPCLFISSQTGSACCPCVFSFCFEWTGGQHVRFTLPPFLSVLIGGSVYPHAAPFLSVSNGGSVYRTCRPLFLSVSTGDSVKLTCRPRFMFFTPQ